MSVRYPWPDRRAAALCVSFDFDGESPHLWRTRENPPSGIAELEQRRYGPRRGIYNVLAALADLGIAATFFVPGWIAERYRQAVCDIATAGHELGLHGWCHEPPGAQSDEDFRSSLSRARDLLGEISGIAPTGYRSPSFQMTPRALEVLSELDLRYDSSLMGSDRPYRIGSLIEIPVDWTTDDAVFYRYNVGDIRPPSPPSLVADSWSAEIDAAVELGSMCTLTAHPWLSGRPARIGALHRMLRRVVDDGHVWIGTVGALAAYHEMLPDAEDVTVNVIPREVGRPG